METRPLRPGKTVLGRGLGNLLGAENKPAATSPDAAGDARPTAGTSAGSGPNSGASPATGPAAGESGKPSPPRVTPGVGALLRGGHSRATETLPGFSHVPNGTASPPKSTPAPESKLATELNTPAWKLPLLLADLLLLGLVALLLLRADGRPGNLEIGLGVVAVGVGAWLACLAVLPARRRK